MQSGHEMCVIWVSAGQHSCLQLLEGKVRQTLPLVHRGYHSRRSDPQTHEEYQERMGRKTIQGTQKLLEVMCAENILLYTPLWKWYLSHGLKVTAIQKYLKYELRRSFEWFLEEVSQASRDGDKNPAMKQLRDTFNLKRNSFYGKMIKDLAKHERMTFTTNKDLVDKSFRSPFFEDLEEIHDWRSRSESTNEG